MNDVIRRIHKIISPNTKFHTSPLKTQINKFIYKNLGMGRINTYIYQAKRK